MPSLCNRHSLPAVWYRWFNGLWAGEPDAGFIELYDMDPIEQVLYNGSHFNVATIVKVLVANTPTLLLPGDAMRWSVILNSSITGSVWIGTDNTVANQRGIFLNTSSTTPIYLNQDTSPGLPQHEIWVFAGVAGNVGAIVCTVLPSSGTKYQSPQTAIRRLQGAGIINSNLQRTGPVATPQEHIAAQLSPLPPVLNVPSGLSLEDYNARSRELSAEIDAIRRTMPSRYRAGRYIGTRREP